MCGTLFNYSTFFSENWVGLSLHKMTHPWTSAGKWSLAASNLKLSNDSNDIRDHGWRKNYCGGISQPMVSYQINGIHFHLDKQKNKREHTAKIVLMFSTNIVPENKEKTRINRD